VRGSRRMQGARHAVQNPGAAYTKGLATAVALPGAPDAFNPQTDAALGLSALLLRMESTSAAGRSSDGCRSPSARRFSWISDVTSMPDAHADASHSRPLGLAHLPRRSHPSVLIWPHPPVSPRCSCAWQRRRAHVGPVRWLVAREHSGALSECSVDSGPGQS
jgi:hypothetical protein